MIQNRHVNTSRFAQKKRAQKSRYSRADCFRFSDAHIGFQGIGNDGSFEIPIFSFQYVICVKQFTFKPTITSWSQQETTNPELPEGAPKGMHVGNRKQICPRKKVTVTEMGIGFRSISIRRYPAFINVGYMAIRYFQNTIHICQPWPVDKDTKPKLRSPSKRLKTIMHVANG